MKTFFIKFLFLAIILCVISCTGKKNEKTYRGDNVEIIGTCFGYLDANMLDADEESISNGNYNLHTDLFLEGYCLTLEKGTKAKVVKTKMGKIRKARIRLDDGRMVWVKDSNVKPTK